MTQPASLTTTYSYDNAWRLISLANGHSETTAFEYDLASRLTKKTFDSGVYETYDYDNRSRVEWIKLFNSSQTQLSSHGYTYDDTSNVLTRNDDGTTTTFAYDDIGQLLSESRADELSDTKYCHKMATLRTRPEIRSEWEVS